MRPQLVDGWLVVGPWIGDEVASVDIGVTSGRAEPEWQPAYLDWYGGERVWKVRPSAGGYPSGVTVWVRSRGVPIPIGNLYV